MGLFDTYTPVPPLRCPVCDSDLGTFQGKDGPCVMDSFLQGKTLPMADFFGEGFEYNQANPGERALTKDRIELHTSDPNDHWIDALGTIKDDVWTETTLVSVRDSRSDVILWPSKERAPTTK